jgi:ribosomal protein S18 acetylase RimI-like enzyme
MSRLIQEVPSSDAPMALLLLADPSEEKVRSYLSRSKCFVVMIHGTVIGACVVQPIGFGVHELMNIAIEPIHQNRGHGTALLKWVMAFFRESGAKQMEVGTGTFGYQLAFYQRHGFRVQRIEHDFFVKNYPEPIVEIGIQLFDMLRLVYRYGVSVTFPHAMQSDLPCDPGRDQ